jgi:hypothetical protein
MFRKQVGLDSSICRLHLACLVCETKNITLYKYIILLLGMGQYGSCLGKLLSNPFSSLLAFFQHWLKTTQKDLFLCPCGQLV